LAAGVLRGYRVVMTRQAALKDAMSLSVRKRALLAVSCGAA
jgi:hypothetical protein